MLYLRIPKRMEYPRRPHQEGRWQHDPRFRHHQSARARPQRASRQDRLAPRSALKKSISTPCPLARHRRLQIDNVGAMAGDLAFRQEVGVDTLVRRPIQGCGSRRRNHVQSWPCSSHYGGATRQAQRGSCSPSDRGPYQSETAVKHLCVVALRANFFSSYRPPDEKASGRNASSIIGDNS